MVLWPYKSKHSLNLSLKFEGHRTKFIRLAPKRKEGPKEAFMQTDGPGLQSFALLPLHIVVYKVETLSTRKKVLLILKKLDIEALQMSSKYNLQLQPMRHLVGKFWMTKKKCLWLFFASIFHVVFWIEVFWLEIVKTLQNQCPQRRQEQRVFCYI